MRVPPGQTAMRAIKLTIPLLLALLFGLFGFGIHYVPHPWASDTKEFISLWVRVIGGIAWILGAYGLIHLHTGRIQRKQPGWGYSVFFFIGLALMAGTAFYNDARWFWNAQAQGGVYDYLSDALFVSTGATMFSLLGFFIPSAAVRTFRARNFEATLLLITAAVVMFGRVPLGQVVSDYLPGAAEWIMLVPNTAAKRAIMLGVSLGVIATSLRLIFGLERSYLGGGE